jgi:hypothetical protein
MRLVLALTLLAAPMFGQAPIAVWDGSSPTFKSMTIGVAHCWFWSQLPASYAPWAVEKVCYINGAAKDLHVAAPGQAIGGWFAYCDNGTFVVGNPGTLPPVLDCGGAPGGNITWSIVPNGALSKFTIIGFPFGGVQNPQEGTF